MNKKMTESEDKHILLTATIQKDGDLYCGYINEIKGCIAQECSIESCKEALLKLYWIKQSTEFNLKSEGKEQLISFDKEEPSKSKAIQYYWCPKCGCKLKHDGFPYWLPKAEGHQIKSGAKLCIEKYVEITKEQYDCPHTYFTKTRYCKFCNIYNPKEDIY
jgi:hypothetical protein